MSCKQSYQCKGDCWLNIAGDYTVWETISKHCKGTSEEKKRIEDIFNCHKPKEELLGAYNFTDKEKDIVIGSWY